MCISVSAQSLRQNIYICIYLHTQNCFWNLFFCRAAPHITSFSRLLASVLPLAPPPLKTNPGKIRFHSSFRVSGFSRIVEGASIIVCLCVVTHTHTHTHTHTLSLSLSLSHTHTQHTHTHPMHVCVWSHTTHSHHILRLLSLSLSPPLSLTHSLTHTHFLSLPSPITNT
jgi:hypothetical protein